MYTTEEIIKAFRQWWEQQFPTYRKQGSADRRVVEFYDVLQANRGQN